MSQTIHKQTIERFELFNMPCTIVQTFIKYHNIITSDQLWFKLHKTLALSGQLQLQELIESCIQEQEQSRLDVLNTKFSLMGILQLLVITWFRLGKIVNSSHTPSQNDRIQIYLQIDSQNQKPSKPILLQIRSSKKLKKQQICKILYSRLHHLCEKYQFQLEMRPNSATMWLKGKDFRYDDISLPPILEISLIDKQFKTKMVSNSNKLQNISFGLNLMQYLSFVKYFEAIPNSKVISLKRFLTIYCRKMQQILGQSDKKFQYYFVLSPRNIVVIDKKQKDQIDFYFSVKSQQLYIYNQNQVPAQAEKSIYFDKPLSQQNKNLLKMDSWSAGLSILALVARWQSLQSFQKHFEDIEKNGQKNVFLKNQIEKLTQDRDIYNQQSINTLKKWLKLTQTNKPIKVNNHNHIPHTNVKKENKIEAPLDWLNDLLESDKQKQSSSQKQIKDLEFIRNLTLNTKKPSPNNYANNTQNRNYTVFSTTGYSNSYSKDTFSKSVQSIVQDAKWEKSLTKLKEIQNVQKNKVYSILGVKMTKERVRVYKQKLYKNKNAYQQLGYYSRGLITKTQSRCPYCLVYKQIITDHCGHRRCINCYQNYVRQRFLYENYDFIICPQSKCDQVVSQQLLESVLQVQKSISKEKFLNNLMSLYVRNNKDPNVRCCQCSEESSYFQTNKNTVMFFCDRCISYRCSKCTKKFHGSIDCEHQTLRNGDLQVQLTRKLKAVFQAKRLVDFKNKKANQEKLLCELKLTDIKMIQELEATLSACVAQAWVLKKKQSEKPQKDANNLLITQAVIDKICSYLNFFYSKFSLIELKPENQIASTAEEVRPQISKIRQLHELSIVILFVSIN